MLFNVCIHVYMCILCVSFDIECAYTTYIFIYIVCITPYRSSKKNVIQKMETFNQLVQQNGKIPGLDGPRKTVVLVISSGPGEGRSLKKAIRPLLEVGYVTLSLYVIKHTFQ